MFYEIFRIIGLITGYPFQLLFFKRKTYYVDKKNTHIFKGGKLIVSNHFSMFDYVLTSFIVFPRKLNVVASEIPFKNKLLKFGMKFFGVIEANRETKNMSFINKCANVLKKGQLVQIYPEGKNSPDGKIHEFKASYTLIAHRANVPIVLVITDGNYGLSKRTSVIISEEIDVSKFMDINSKTTKKEDRERLNNYIHTRALELRAELENLKNKKKER
ncbi:MAG: 1-acyl-sn-glycerol-3-phosphate acyltransferase [Bacilli bacterium]|nr:1-acyl-sn-glycerol-3-phosphate acyltransferase [Bacilli bacterium]